MYLKLTATLLLCMLASSATGSQLLRLEVERHADVYEIEVEMTINAPADKVRAILTDYANLHRLNASITSSSVIDGSHNGSVRVRTRIESCILFFCRKLDKVEDVKQDAQGRILASMVPAASSFRSGHASWELRAAGETTRVIHHAKLEPDIGVPAWIGNTIVKDTLRRELLESFETLACLAREQCLSFSQRAAADHPSCMLEM